jgi:hypothetical protein
LASYSSAPRSLFNPHSFNLSPTVVENDSASSKGVPFRVTGHQETNLGLSERIQRKMVIAFWRIEAAENASP